MATNCLHEWLLDPLFAPAEDVQESADRLESSFRTWQQETQEGIGNTHTVEAQRLRLMSACDTVRWQLEVFERAVQADRYVKSDATVVASVHKRRGEFVEIIRQQLQSIESHVRRNPHSKPISASSSHVSLPDLGSPPKDSGSSTPTGGGGARAEQHTAPEVPRSPASQLTGFFEMATNPPSMPPSWSSLGSEGATFNLGGFLGISCPEPDEAAESAAASRNLGSPQCAGVSETLPKDEGSSSPETGLRHPSVACGHVEAACMSSASRLEDFVGTEPEKTQSVLLGNSARDASDHVDTPGPEGKTFPSFAHGGYSGVHGWQCLLFWVYHLQRVTRRKQLEFSKDNEGVRISPVAGPSGPKHVPDFVAVSSSRCEASQSHPISRTTSAANFANTDQHKNADWHIDVPKGLQSSDDEGTKKAGTSWHLARPRRLSSFSRPARLSHRLILVCAAVVVMVAAACYCSMTRSTEFEQRHALLMQLPTIQASSPSFP